LFADQAGVGLFFSTLDGDSSRIIVKTVVKGGSADREGTIRVGDVLRHIDGQPITDTTATLADLRARVLGEIGTFVTFGFERRDGTDDQLYSYDISLMRGNADFFAQLKIKHQLAQEVNHTAVCFVHLHSFSPCANPGH
jgi:C-terminal processing protease CtpA/Prc